MVQKGEAKLECDEDCNAHKVKQKKETTKEEELRKQEELRAQQVILLIESYHQLFSTHSDIGKGDVSLLVSIWI